MWHEQRIQDFVESLKNRSCWYVCCGGSAGARFSISLGGKVKRTFEVQNLLHPIEFRQFEGEFDLYVETTWRLDSQTGPMCSSNFEADGFGNSIDTLEQQLTGATVVDIRISYPVGDLTIEFTSGLILRVFCTDIRFSCPYAGNWSITNYSRVLSADGTGRVTLGERELLEPPNGDSE